MWENRLSREQCCRQYVVVFSAVATVGQSFCSKNPASNLTILYFHLSVWVRNTCRHISLTNLLDHSIYHSYDLALHLTWKFLHTYKLVSNYNCRLPITTICKHCHWHYIGNPIGPKEKQEYGNKKNVYENCSWTNLPTPTLLLVKTIGQQRPLKITTDQGQCITTQDVD